MTRGLLHADSLRSTGVIHGFTTRLLGDMRDLRLWEEATGLSRSSLVQLNQVHGADVLVVGGSPSALPPEEERRFDACLTDRPGVLVGVRTADCVPILLVSEEPRAVGAVHGGWRGTLSGIAERTVLRLQQVYGCDPSSLRAVIGPCIRECCFEVGPEVFDPFLQELGPEVAFVRNGRRIVDLVQANRLWLLRAGLSASRIENLERCTRCQEGLFFSFRREGPGVGRLLAYAGWPEEGDRHGTV